MCFPLVLPKFLWMPRPLPGAWSGSGSQAGFHSFFPTPSPGKGGDVVDLPMRLELHVCTAQLSTEM